MPKQTALITGVSSQDGALLAQLLDKEGVVVHGSVRRSSGDNLWRLDRLRLLDSVRLHEWNLEDPHSISETIRQLQPSMIFHLAAESFTWDSVIRPYPTLSANILGTLGVLEAARKGSRDSTVVLAGSSEVFGRESSDFSANEMSPHRPSNPYGVSKSAASQLADVYRSLHGLRTRVAILFNHESELRSPQFVTRKITLGLAAFERSGNKRPFTLGNVSSSRDWGSAREYVRGMLMLASSETDYDVVFGTGQLNTVLDWLRYCGEELDLDILPLESDQGLHIVDVKSGATVVQVDSGLMRTQDLVTPSADWTLAKEVLDWCPRTSARTLAMDMMRSEMEFFTPGRTDA